MSSIPIVTVAGGGGGLAGTPGAVPYIGSTGVRLTSDPTHLSYAPTTHELSASAAGTTNGTITATATASGGVGVHADVTHTAGQPLKVTGPASMTGKLIRALVNNVEKFVVDNLGGIFGAYLDLPEASAPANPAASTQRLYFKTDHLPYSRNSSGTETPLGGGGSSLQVQDEGGAALPAHPYLNFVGGKVAAYEDIPNDAVVVQIDANVIIPTPAVAGQVTYFVDIDQIGGHTGFTYDDASGQLGTGYLELAAIAAPTAPASGFGRLYVDVADGHLKFKKNGGAVVDIG